MEGRWHSHAALPGALVDRQLGRSWSCALLSPALPSSALHHLACSGYVSPCRMIFWESTLGACFPFET